MRYKSTQMNKNKELQVSDINRVVLTFCCVHSNHWVNVPNLAQVPNWCSLVKTSLELQSCSLFQINRPTCILLVYFILWFVAQDRVGHVTEVTSEPVIVDSTPPSVEYVGAGTATDDTFLSGPELSVHWEGVEDVESGILKIEVSELLAWLSYSNTCRPTHSTGSSPKDLATCDNFAW
jgi:hypothetical protein